MARRYEKKGRVYLDLSIEVRETDSGQLVASYEDTAILNYSPGAQPLEAAQPGRERQRD